MSKNFPHPRNGFASMERDRLIALAGKAGSTAHANGTAHTFDAEEARLAGKKGGAAVSRDRQHMAAIGRRGGLARAKRSGEKL